MLALEDLLLREGCTPISQTFDPASVTVVLGRNLSGKTLLARVIAGLEQPLAGRIRLDGRDVTDVPAGRRGVALVYQVFVNYPQWTVYRNIASPLLARRVDKARIRDTVHDVAGRLGLEGLLDRLPSELSGGQQQRVAIGRALAAEASVLVMDEPLVNLDYKLRESLTAELRGLLAEAGVTVVYTTSDPRDAFALGDEVVLLADHAVVQTGAPLAVYERPVSAAAMDLMSEPGANRLPDAGNLRVVRPEHLSLEREAADDHAFAATVLSRETNGAETYLHCDVSGEHWVARLVGLEDVAEGRAVELYAARDAVHVFAREAAVG